MFTRHGYARCMNDMGLDVACPEPARQPKAVPTGLESDSDACDPVSCLLCFLAPSMQQLQPCSLVAGELLQRLTLDARYDARNERARLAHFNHGDYRAVWFEEGEASAQVIQLLHGALHRFTSAPVDTTSSPLPHSISVGGMPAAIRYFILICPLFPDCILCLLRQSAEDNQQTRVLVPWLKIPSGTKSRAAVS